MVSSLNIFEENRFYEIKIETLFTQKIICQDCIRKVRMRKNEKHFSRRLNIQVRELLQVLTEANIKRYFEK